MAEGNVSHANQNRAESNTKLVYYTGTDTLYEGYVLCYQEDATENGTSPSDRLGVTVEKPANSNLNLCAGFVSSKSNGFADGPGWVEVVVPSPRQPVQAFTDADMTVMATALAPQNASYALAAHSDSGLNLPAVAIAGVTENTDTTNALSTVFWL